MDPMSISLAVGAFISVTKDITEIAKELTIFCKNNRNAHKIYKEFLIEIQLLQRVLEQLSDPDLLRAGDGQVRQFINSLHAKVEVLSKSINKLEQKKGIAFRVSTALKVKHFKEQLSNIESAKTTAMLALQILTYAAMQQRIDTQSLRQADPESLHSQTAVTIQQSLLVAQNNDPFDMTTQPASMVTQRRHYASRRQSRALFTFKPWYLNQIWTFCLEYAPDIWAPTLRISRIIWRDSAIVQAVRVGNVAEARKLFMLGEASPTDIVRGRYGSHVPLILLVQDRHRKLEMYTLFFQMSSLADDKSIILTLLAHDKVNHEPYRLVVEQSDIDLTTDWVEWTDPDSIFQPVPRYRPHWDDTVRDWILQRQITLVGGYHFKRPEDLFKYDPQVENHWFGFRELQELLALHGIQMTKTSLGILSQQVKDWILFWAIATGWTILGIDCAELVAMVIQAGAKWSSRWGRYTAFSFMIEMICRESDLCRSDGLSKDFSRWTKLLLMTTTMLETGIGGSYLMRPREALENYVAGLDSYCYEPTDGVSHLSFLIRWQPQAWRRQTMPGHWPLTDYHPEVDLWTRRSAGHGWTRTDFRMPVIRIRVDHDGLLEHFGLINNHMLETAEDDHGLIARSCLKTRCSSSIQTRSRSQPRSLAGMTWSFARDHKREWLEEVRWCPFDPYRRLHAEPYPSHALFEKRISCCLLATTPYTSDLHSVTPLSEIRRRFVPRPPYCRPY